MKIDLCKLFGVEEGEEFKIEGEPFSNNCTYKIINNTLLAGYKDSKLYWSSLPLNDTNKITEIIKVPKKKQFTDDELAILRCMDKKYKWITRDKRYGLTVFENKPRKATNSIWKVGGDWLDLGCFENKFKTIQWEDEEPVLIDDYVER